MDINLAYMRDVKGTLHMLLNSGIFSRIKPLCEKIGYLWIVYFICIEAYFLWVYDYFAKGIT